MSESRIVAALRHIEQSFGNAVLVGGAAMQLMGMERVADDVDCHAVRAALAGQSLSFGGIDIDVVGDERLWGRIRMPDLATHGSFSMHEARVATPETLFVLKADAGREKDIEDLVLIAGHTTPEQVAKRLHQLEAHNTSRDMFFIAENVISEAVMNWPGVSYGEMLDLCQFKTSLHNSLAETLAPEKVCVEHDKRKVANG